MLWLALIICNWCFLMNYKVLQEAWGTMQRNWQFSLKTTWFGAHCYFTKWFSPKMLMTKLIRLYSKMCIHFWVKWVYTIKRKHSVYRMRHLLFNPPSPWHPRRWWKLCSSSFLLEITHLLMFMTTDCAFLMSFLSTGHTVFLFGCMFICVKSQTLIKVY